MSCWAKVVGLVLVAAIVFVVVAPDIDLHPTISRAPHVGQKLRVALFHHTVMRAVLIFPLLISAGTRMRTSLDANGGSFADLIDLECSRRC